MTGGGKFDFGFDFKKPSSSSSSSSPHKFEAFFCYITGGANC
jgi:hypothetical protein